MVERSSIKPKVKGSSPGSGGHFVRGVVVWLSVALRAQLLKKSACLVHQIDNKAPPGARDSSEVDV